MVLVDGRVEYLMGLNIKNEETHRLARELADLTGESLTAAVTEAVKERLERVRRAKNRDDLVEWIMAMAKETAPLFKEPYRSIDHADFLYDEYGLPK
jgi:antitoxin VapB